MKPAGLQPASSLYSDVRTILEAARASAYRAVNFAMVTAYWEVGRRIVEEEQGGEARAEFGKGVLEELSEKLTADFGKGFGENNLRYMRLFYQAFPIRHALRDELSWTHYRLLSKEEKEAARTYYMNEAAAAGWSTRTLERQITTLAYDRILGSGAAHKAGVKAEADAIREGEAPHSLDLIKDPYVLEFLALKPHAGLYEADIEQAILDNLQEFLLEMGRGFSFVARQKRITLDGDHFRIDLVFYNYLLKCFVLIDLKLGKLTHGDVGQLDMYVRWWEENGKTPGDNPTIGIILCAEKNEAVARYSVLQGSEQLFASKYRLHLPTVEELEAELREGMGRVNGKNV